MCVLPATALFRIASYAVPPLFVQSATLLTFFKVQAASARWLDALYVLPLQYAPNATHPIISFSTEHSAAAILRLLLSEAVAYHAHP